MLRFWKEEETALLLKFQIHPNVGLVCVFQFWIVWLLLQCAAEPSYSLCPQSAVLMDPDGSKDGNDGIPRSWKATQVRRKYGYLCFFALSLLTSYIKFQWSPQAAKDSPASLQRNAGRQHTAAVCTQVIMWPTQPITGQRSQVSKSKYT